jgi:hypothetical protein
MHRNGRWRFHDAPLVTGCSAYVDWLCKRPQNEPLPEASYYHPEAMGAGFRCHAERRQRPTAAASEGSSAGVARGRAGSHEGLFSPLHHGVGGVSDVLFGRVDQAFGRRGNELPGPMRIQRHGLPTAVQFGTLNAAGKTRRQAGSAARCFKTSDRWRC